MKKYILALICLISVGQQSLGESIILDTDRKYIERQINKEVSAEDTLKEISFKLKNDNKNYDLYYQRGNIYYEMSEDPSLPNKEAFKLINLSVEDFENSIKLNPDYSKSYISLSLSLLKVNNVLNGMLLELDKDFDKHRYMDKLANKTSLYKFGRSKLEKMGKEYNAILKNIKSLEQTASLTKKYAFESIKTAESLDNKDPYVYRAYTYYYMNQADFKNAEESMKKALAISGSNHELYNTYGMLNMAEKDYRSAELNFKTALDLMPNKIEYIKNLSDIYIKNNDPEKVFNIVNRQLELNPDNKTLKKMYISALKLLPDNSTRLQKLDMLVNSTKDKSSFNSLSSESYVIMANFEKDTNKSLEFVKASLQADPNNEKARTMVVKSYIEKALKQKNQVDKIKILEDTLKSHPDNLTVETELAKSYKLNKNYDKALKSYSNLINYNNSNAEYYYQRALIYALKKDKVNSIINVKKAISLDKKYKKIYKTEPLLSKFRFR